MSSKHDFSYPKRRTRLAVASLFTIALLATGMVTGIPDAEARGGGGGGAARAGGGGGGAAHAAGGGGGRKAQTSVSGVNHAASRPSGGGGYKGNSNAGNINKGNVNTGNVNRGNVNTGNVNRGNINTGNVNIGNDINIDIDGGYGYGHGGYYHHPIATGVAIGAVAATTAAVLGSSYYALPPGCSNVYRNGISYYYCGSVYYQQSWSGNDVVYIVVNP